jgi:regulator of replication initiation timing
VIDPTGPASGSNKVLRGGSWNDDGTWLRSAKRNRANSGYRDFGSGFRVGFQKVTDEKSASEPTRSALKDGLIGHWAFDETEGSIAHDASGNENHGQLHNGPTWTTGKIGGALNFDGVNDRVKLPAEMLKDLVNLTFSFWFLESQQPQEFHTFISAANNVTHNHILFIARSTGKIDYFDQLKPETSHGEMLFSYDYGKRASNWTKIAIVRDNYSSNLFIDGDLHKSYSRENHRLDISPNGLWIGGDQDRIGSRWDHRQQLNGILDDYRIYNRALSANEIKELYELGNKSSKPAPDATPPKTGPGNSPDLKCKETIAKLEQQIKDQKIEITNLNTLIIELRKQVADLNSSNFALTTEVSGLKNQVNNLSGQVASLTTENGELKGQVTTLREDNGNLQSNITSLNEQLVESDRIAKTPFVHDWVYTPNHGWLHIDPQNFPIIYKNDTQTWHFYEQGSINPRYFYNFNQQKWEAWDSIPSGNEN